MDETKLIADLMSDGLSHERALGRLYRHRPYRKTIIYALNKRGLNRSEAESLWTDIVVQFSSLVRRGKYEDQGKLLGYLQNLARFMALNHFRAQKKQPKTVDLDEREPVSTDAFDTLLKPELKSLLNSQLQRLGEVCQQILMLWAGGYSMKEITSNLKLTSEGATRKRKHGCMKSLLEYIHAQPEVLSELRAYHQSQ